jgi:nucleoside-diphosphate-sugar epimerase
MRIAIIGCGYVGGEVGRLLVGHGHDVVGTTTTPSRREAIRLTGVKADRLAEVLRDRELVLLTIAPAPGGDYREVYLKGVGQLLGALPGSEVRRIIYTSSTSVYAQEDGSWVDESSPAEPDSDNGRVLRETERALLAGTEGSSVATTVLRLSGIYGPGRDPATRLSRLAGSERDDGESYVNMVHSEDLVSALIRLVDHPFCGLLNLSDDHPTTRREYYDRLMATAGLAPVLWRPPQGPAKLGKRVRNDLIKRTLGLTLRHPAH